MPDLLIDAINLLRDSAWGGVAVVVAILVPTLGVVGRAVRNSRTSDLTREELRLLKAFNREARGDLKAYLKPEFVAYRAKLDNYDVKVERLKDLGYLQDSNIRDGYLGHRPVWITARGVKRAEKRR
jgi:hypothetical protein